MKWEKIKAKDAVRKFMHLAGIRGENMPHKDCYCGDDCKCVQIQPPEDYANQLGYFNYGLMEDFIECSWNFLHGKPDAN